MLAASSNMHSLPHKSSLHMYTGKFSPGKLARAGKDTTLPKAISISYYTPKRYVAGL